MVKLRRAKAVRSCRGDRPSVTVRADRDPEQCEHRRHRQQSLAGGERANQSPEPVVETPPPGGLE